MRVMEELENLSKKMNEDPKEIEGVEKTYQFDITGEEEGVFQIQFTDGQVHYQKGKLHAPDCTLKMKDNNFLKLVQGELNPATAFMTGKLKIEGGMGNALKLQKILETYN
ncbi:SCP2 sterol-binding domain-containing protein [Thalassobacillus sp. C254]|uniref:SCP2 sterol-binding domain-containing protein n=1 Tax=Thalassobacillus sp. C254 TaxID=1225341 RepID=UPI0006D1BEFF|nr:SCP2 sterol-binding domain-containing protein [Thalassobacillus sp. C254]